MPVAPQHHAENPLMLLVPDDAQSTPTRRKPSKASKLMKDTKAAMDNTTEKSLQHLRSEPATNSH